MSEQRVCSKCGTAIGKAGKTGLCRPCAGRATLARKDAPEPTVVAGLNVPESIARPKTIFEDQFDESRVRVQDRPIGPGPKNDPTIVYGKDPKKHYRWVTEDPAHVARARAKGYKPVKRGEGGLDAPYLDHGRADKYVGHDGLALMECPVEVVEARRSKPVPKPKDQAQAEMNRAIEDAQSKDLMSKADAARFRGQFQERSVSVNTDDLKGASE